MKTILKNNVVTLEYAAADTDGNLIDTGKEPLIYLHGGYDGIFLPVETALEGKSVGDDVTVKLQPADAFGEYDPELVNIVPLADLPQPLSVGMQIEGSTEDGDETVTFFSTVTDIADGVAVLDANHPLAGQALIVHCTVKNIRAATAEEIAAGLPQGTTVLH
ncbi:MAG: peptidylprolyl isomerase [Geobacter sp.]|nr:peptidylprolyl isomerase [Geobacter sp.]